MTESPLGWGEINASVALRPLLSPSRNILSAIKLATMSLSFSTSPRLT